MLDVSLIVLWASSEEFSAHHYQAHAKEGQTDFFLSIYTKLTKNTDLGNDHALNPMNKPHLGQIDQIDRDLDNLGLNLPFWGAVQDLYSAGPIQETCPTADHADYVAPTRQRELLDHKDQGSICPDRQI